LVSGWEEADVEALRDAMLSAETQFHRLSVEDVYRMPDVMVIDPLPRNRHPATALLVIEVAVTTHRHDAWKARRYAGAGVGEYWIVDLPGRIVTVNRDPGAVGYHHTSRHGDGDPVEPQIGPPAVEITGLLGSP
jgi:Uma2 family endonuclease